MIKNAEFVIYAYSFAGTVLIAYSVIIFVRLKRIRKKLSDLKENE